MEKLILKLLSTDDEGERERLLLTYPVLLSQAVAQTLDKVTEHPDFSHPLFQERLALWRRCRSEGLVSVFPTAFPAQLAKLARFAKADPLYVPAGFCLLGSDVGDAHKRESPARQAHVAAFNLDKYPVTNSDYARFVLETDYPTSQIRPQAQLSGPGIDEASKEGLQALSDILTQSASRGFRTELGFMKPKHPVTEVSWYDSVEYARWSGKRLPTADEWEKAARGASVEDGGGAREWSWGDEPGGEKGNTLESAIETTTPVDRYDAWPSPNGCCDMSGNVFEWTATPSVSSEWSREAFVIKGGCWMFATDEAKVWKRHDDPPEDLWNALGFRCCESALGETREVNPRASNESDVNYGMIEEFGIDPGDDPALLILPQLAQSVLTQSLSLEDAIANLVAAFQRPEIPPGTDREFVGGICDHILSLQGVLPGELGDMRTLPVIAQIGTALAEKVGDEGLVARALFGLGHVMLLCEDANSAVEVFGRCLQNHRAQGGAATHLVGILLALGTAEATQNLTSGTEPIGARTAQEHLLEALPLAKDLCLHREEHAIWAQLAHVKRLLGEKEESFTFAQRALSDTLEFSGTVHEVRGIVVCGEMFLDLHALDHALYCFRTAYRLASRLAVPELLISSRLHTFNALTLCDKERAARCGAEILEEMALLGLDRVDKLLNLLVQRGHGSTYSWTLANFLGAFASRNQHAKTRLPFLPHAEAIIRLALDPTADFGNQRAELAGLETQAETLFDKFISKGIMSLLHATSSPELAKEAIDEAVEAAVAIDDTAIRATARQLRAETCRLLGYWDDAKEDLNVLRTDLKDRLAPELHVAYLDFEARIKFWGGWITEALEACDEATITAYEELPPLTSSRSAAELHLLRSAIFSSLGTRDGFIESEAAKLLYFHSGDRLGSVRQILRQAQASLDEIGNHARPGTEEAQICLSIAWRRIQEAVDFINHDIGGEIDRYCRPEVLCTIAEFLLHSGRPAEAAEYFEQAYVGAREIGNDEGEVKALTGLWDVSFRSGDVDAAEAILTRVVPLIEKRRRSAEQIEAMTRAARTHLVKRRFGEAYESARLALTLYHRIRETIVNNAILRKAWLRKNQPLFAAAVESALSLPGKSSEAYAIAQDAKAAWLQDMMSEHRLLTTGLLSPEKAEELKRVWQDIRSRDLELEQRTATVGDELDEYRLRVELRALRHQWTTLMEELGRGSKHTIKGEAHFSAGDLAAECSRLPKGTAVVDFFVMAEQVMCFVLSGPKGLHCTIQLQQVGGTTLAELIDKEFLQPYRALRNGSEPSEIAERNKDFRTRLSLLLNRVYTELFLVPGSGGESLSDVLGKLGATRLILVPSGALSVLPLHAIGPGTEGSSPCLIDQFESIAYVPSLNLLIRSLDQSTQTGTQVFIAQNPDRTLAYADSEVAALKALFPTASIAAHEEATKDAIIKAMQTSHFLHFACHGVFNHNDPLSSGLALADETLSIQDLFLHAALAPGSTVTLAACESGIVDPLFANEFVGLPAAFLYAGACGLISSLWEVDSRSTSLLMQRFYTERVQRGVHAGEALRTAQRWLRDATREQISAYYQTTAAMDLQEADAAVIELMLRYQPGEKPYSHPYHWAAYTYFGA